MMNKTELAVNLFNHHAVDYQNKFMNLELYHSSYDLFCEAVTCENAAVLELACGPGNITRYVQNKRPDFKILATDLAEKMLALGRINVPEAEFQLMDSRKLEKLDQNFDAIICGFCLPYLSKEEAVELIASMSKKLNRGGVVYISTMEDDYENSRIEKSSSGEHELFTYFHEAGYLTSALEKNQFKILSLDRKEFIRENDTRYDDLIIIARKED